MDIASPTSTDLFLLTLQAYQELQAGVQPSGAYSPQPGNRVEMQPAVSQQGFLQLGLAEDGLPLTIDLYDASPGPLLVAGDARTGKTRLLQTLARATGQGDPGDIQFAVLTPFPEEWQALDALPGNLGVWPTYHASAREFLDRMLSWSKALPESRQIVVLFIDALELLDLQDVHLRDGLYWLLRNGPGRQIWPVVAANPGRLPRLQLWLDFFSTRILSPVRQPQVAERLLDAPPSVLAGLTPGRQFVLSLPDSWLRFQPVRQAGCQ
jgi:hypothetical protein